VYYIFFRAILTFVKSVKLLNKLYKFLFNIKSIFNSGALGIYLMKFMVFDARPDDFLSMLKISFYIILNIIYIIVFYRGFYN